MKVERYGAFHWQRWAGMLLILGVLALVTSATLAISEPEEGSPGVALSPGVQQRGLPQEAVFFAHTLTNTGAVTDTFVLSLTWSVDWDAVMYIEETGSMLLTPVTLGPLLTRAVTTSLTAPVTAYSGTVGQITLRAASLISPNVYVVVTDTLTVYRVPGVALSPGQARTVRSGDVVTLTHCVTNTGPLTDTFALTAQISPTWPLMLQRVGWDPSTSYLPMPPLGELENLCFDVRVEVPPEVPPYALGEITLRADSLMDESVYAVVTDTLRVEDRYQVFLPLVEKYAPPEIKLGVDFGIIITRTDVISYDLPIIKEMGVGWVRVFLGWYQIETEPGVYDWSIYDAIFAGLETNQLNALVLVYGAPAWAAEESCGPISDTVAFSDFIDILVPRYAGVARAWEFINEPDGREPHYYGPAIGCWATDPAAYVAQLGDFYRQVKSLDRTADVFFGGLAYDNWGHFERDFFTQTLALGAGRYFDGVSLHYYPINLIEFPTMGAKVNEIAAIMRAHGVTRKKIWVTETSMWFAPLEGSYSDVEMQRDYIVQQLTYGYAAGAEHMFWFQVRDEGWNSRVRRWLIDINHQPVNGYTTFVNYADKMTGRRYQGRYAAPEGVEAFIFSDATSKLYVLWTTGMTQTVTIPATAPALLTGRDGEMTRTLPVTAGSVTVAVGPRAVFIETP